MTEPVPADAEPTPLGVHLDRLAAGHPDRSAVICEDDVLTFDALVRRANQLARVMAARGVRHGDLVTIALPNRVEFYVAVVAAWKLGAVPQPVSSKLPPAELSAILEIANPALVIGLEPADRRPWLPSDLAIPEGTSDAPHPPAIPPAWKAPASGGSTGRPKVVVSGTPGTAEDVLRSVPLLRMEEGERFLCTAPLSHGAPFMFSLIALLYGGTIVLMPRFDAEEMLRKIDQHRITWLYLVPTMMVRVSRLPEPTRAKYDLSSVRIAFHVGAPCPPEVKRAWIYWLGPERVLELYAGVEGQAVTFLTGTEWLAKPGSVGRVWTGEVRVLDEEGQEVPADEIGEIWMRAVPGTVPYRYLGAKPRARGEWESLGDMGRIDADGYLFLADRRTDMILVGGANVYPAEIENALSEHPSVLSACVIGLPDDDFGQRVHAIVELSAPMTDEELHRHLAERLVPYKRPRSFERSTEPLRDDAGKVRRSALRAARLGQPT